MGRYVDNLRYEKWRADNKEKFEFKTVLVKKFFGIPYLWIKQPKYEKKYMLFNIIPILSIVDYSGGFENTHE